LKQLCTNLVVKLDLPMDVQDIDTIVQAAGVFEDDNVDGDASAPPKGKRNNWQLEAFITWFCKKDCFNVDASWSVGDQSDEDEDPTPERPFLTGTYVGVVEGGGKKYTVKKRVGGKMGNDSKLEGFTTEEVPEFMFKIRQEADGTTLKPRPGCDAVGFYRSSGSIDGTKITMVLEYDLDDDQSTAEPKLVLEGEWGGADDPKKIKGTWKNANADKEEAADLMKTIGLEGVQEGTFELVKRERADE